MTAQVPNLDNIGLSQFRHAVLRAAIARAVDQAVGLILRARCPAEVTLGDAGKMAFAAAVSGLVSWGWCGAMLRFACKARHTLTVYPRISMAVIAVGPDQTGIVGAARVGQDNVFQESPSVAAGNIAAERVSMPAKSVGVRTAIAARVMRLVAVFNQAFSESHFDGPFVGVVRARRSAGTLGGFVIGTSWPLEISCMRGAR